MRLQLLFVAFDYDALSGGREAQLKMLVIKNVHSGRIQFLAFFPSNIRRRELYNDFEFENNKYGPVT